MLGRRNLVKFFTKKIFFCILVTIFCTSVFADPSYPEVEKKNVKVGFYEMEGAQKIDKDGNLSGFYYDYLQAIMQYNSWDLEFITNCDWDSCLEMLKTGEIDILCGVQKKSRKRKSL